MKRRLYIPLTISCTTGHGSLLVRLASVQVPTVSVLSLPGQKYVLTI